MLPIDTVPVIGLQNHLGWYFLDVTDMVVEQVKEGDAVLRVHQNLAGTK